MVRPRTISALVRRRSPTTAWICRTGFPSRTTPTTTMTARAIPTTGSGLQERQRHHRHWRREFVGGSYVAPKPGHRTWKSSASTWTSPSTTTMTRCRGGAAYRTTSMSQRRLVTAQILGDWGVTRPRVTSKRRLPGALEAYCLSLPVRRLRPRRWRNGIPRQRGRAVQRRFALLPGARRSSPSKPGTTIPTAVEEDISSVYAQSRMEG